MFQIAIFFKKIHNFNHKIKNINIELLYKYIDIKINGLSEKYENNLFLRVTLLKYKQRPSALLVSTALITIIVHFT